MAACCFTLPLQAGGDVLHLFVREVFTPRYGVKNALVYPYSFISVVVNNETTRCRGGVLGTSIWYDGILEYG